MNILRIAIYLTACCPFLTLMCQNDISDYDVKQLLLRHQISDSTFQDREITYGFGDNNRTVNPFYHVLSSSMFVYQQCVSAVLSRRCAFIPSCSAYSKILIQKYGIPKGVCFTADRLMRCNRIALADKNNTILLMEGQGHIYESEKRYQWQ